MALQAMSDDPPQSIHENIWHASQGLAGAILTENRPNRAKMWEELMAVAIESESPHEVLQQVANQWESQSLVTAFSTLFEQVSACHPRLAEELPARVRPLREQWEARAPGFLLALGEPQRENRQLPPLVLALVAPVLGGHASMLGAHRATFEAVLYHPLPAIPEPIRIGWLVAQHLGNHASRETLRRVHHAAQSVEWLSSAITVNELAGAWKLDV